MWKIKESQVDLINLPNEILAMRTECWLLEESWNEAMVLDVKDVLLFQCTFSVSVSNIDFILLLLRHIIVSHFDSLSCLAVFVRGRVLVKLVVPISSGRSL